MLRKSLVSSVLLIATFVSGNFDISKTKEVKICFYANTASERGTEIAMYDYAVYAEKLLKMKSHIIFPRILETSNHLSDNVQPGFEFNGVGGAGCRASSEKFRSRFNVSFCGEPYSDELYERVKSEYASSESPNYPLCNNLAYEAKHNFGCDVLYLTKGGLIKHAPMHPDAFGHLPTMVHAVFNWEPHGNVYAGISPSIKNYRPRDRGNIVPYMVIPPDPAVVQNAHSYRDHFRIPATALVVCRHGGDESFNIKYAHMAVVELLGRYDESRLHFVFLNTESFKHQFAKLAQNTTQPQFYQRAGRKQVHFIPPTTDARVKENYFKTCDVMLHAREIGETFGLAVAEFSVRNKPVITQQAAKRYSDFHLRVLGDKGYLYGDQQGVVEKISYFVENGVPKDADFNCYREYLPERVMEIFKSLLLDPALALMDREDVGNVATQW